MNSFLLTYFNALILCFWKEKLMIKIIRNLYVGLSTKNDLGFIGLLIYSIWENSMYLINKEWISSVI
jgi:hypothetical protein